MDDFTKEIRQELKQLLSKVPGMQTAITDLDNSKHPWNFLDVFNKASLQNCMCGKRYHGSKIEGSIYLGKNSIISSSARLYGPIIVGNNVTIDDFVKIRPFTIICDNCKVNFSEIKNSIILPNTNIPHFNYVGDSILGKNCNLGAGTKVANLRLDKNTIRVYHGGKVYDSNRRKLGVILESNVHTGCNVVLNPGTYIEANTMIYIDTTQLVSKKLRKS